MLKRTKDKKRKKEIFFDLQMIVYAMLYVIIN